MDSHPLIERRVRGGTADDGSQPHDQQRPQSSTNQEYIMMEAETFALKMPLTDEERSEFSRCEITG